MAKIMLSDIAQNGVKGATKRKARMGTRYKEVMQEADARIKEDHVRYATAYEKASTYMTR